MLSHPTTSLYERHTVCLCCLVLISVYWNWAEFDECPAQAQPIIRTLEPNGETKRLAYHFRFGQISNQPFFLFFDFRHRYRDHKLQILLKVFVALSFKSLIKVEIVNMSRLYIFAALLVLLSTICSAVSKVLPFFKQFQWFYK